MHLQAHAGHADRVADAFLRIVQHVVARDRVQDPLVGRDRHRLGGLQHAVEVAVGDLAVADRGDACELRHCTWLPLIEAYTLRTSQPAISSASSTARWIDCTVESMSTTTPRRRPRDSCEPMPITSIGSPGAYSPTSAVTLEVPDVQADDQRLVALAVQ